METLSENVMRKIFNLILALITLATVSGCAFVAPRDGYSGSRVEIISVRPAPHYVPVVPYYAPSRSFGWHGRSHRHW